MYACMCVCVCYEQKYVGEKDREGQQVWYATVRKVSKKASRIFAL